MLLKSKLLKEVKKNWRWEFIIVKQCKNYIAVLGIHCHFWPTTTHPIAVNCASFSWFLFFIAIPFDLWMSMPSVPSSYYNNVGLLQAFYCVYSTVLEVKGARFICQNVLGLKDVKYVWSVYFCTRGRTHLISKAIIYQLENRPTLLFVLAT